MKNAYVLSLGPRIKKFYEGTLKSPANWRMITQLSALDEQEEHAEREREGSAAERCETDERQTRK